MSTTVKQLFTMELSCVELNLEINQICRLCLRSHDQFCNIYVTESSESHSCAEMISILSGLRVHDKDGLPTYICPKCKEELGVSFKFRENIIRSYDILSERLININLNKTSFQKVDVVISDDRNTRLSNNSLKITKNKSTVLKNQNKCVKVRKKLIKTDNKALSIKNRNKCPLCLTDFEDSVKMTEHIQGHYVASDLTPLFVDGKKTEVCNLCDKVLKYRTMIPHHRIHLKIYPFKCEMEDCDESFITSQYLTIHMSRHTGLRKYQCQSCGKTFALRGSLKNHEETHIFETAQCKICQRTYKNNIMLKIHMKRHKNGLKYKCKEQGCDKAFYLLQELKRHMRVHNNERPYVCDVCNKAWYTNSELERHRRYHSAIRQYICKLCSKSFVERTHLRHHEMKHRGERPHVCEFCSMAFIARSKLKRHQMKSCKHINPGT